MLRPERNAVIDEAVVAESQTTKIISLAAHMILKSLSADVQAFKVNSRYGYDTGSPHIFGLMPVGRRERGASGEARA
jgi:hypothetical protein